jgi:hypothetical protein
MNNSILIAVMVTVGFFMAMIPIIVFIGLRILIKAETGDLRLLSIYLIGSLMVMFGLSIGAFAFIQRYNCGSVKNMKQVASNAGISMAIHAVFMGLSWCVPWLRGIIVKLFPTTINPVVVNSIAYSYYSFWGALFGIAVGGSLSAIC